MWEAAANITFREVPEGTRADILIGAQMEPEGWAFADVFYDIASSEPYKPISRALVCLNPLRRWKIGFDGDLKKYDLRYTFAHEIGHAIGLDHPGGGDQIMGYRYEEHFRTLQSGDIRGAVALYGEARHAGLTQIQSGPHSDAGAGLLGSPLRQALGNERLQRTFSLSSTEQLKEFVMGRGLILWLVGIPLPIVLLLYFFGYLS